MKLRVLRIADAGDLNKERIVMKAASTLDVGEYLVIKVSTFEEKVTTDVSATYWFPDKEVSPGDFVILYSKKGKDNEKPFKEVKSHFFYWGQAESLWGKDDVAPILLNAPEWDTLPSE